MIISCLLPISSLVLSMRIRASRVLCRVNPPVKALWSASRLRPSAPNAHIRRHGLFSESARRTPGQIRGFSATRSAQFMLDGDSTIYALSTAPGRAAIAVVRVSGPACVPVCRPNRRYLFNTKPARYTTVFAQTHPSLSLALQLSALFMTRRSLQPRTQFSTPALSSSTSLPPAP